MGRYKENEIMKFLELYRRYECLWKCNHKFYRLKTKRVEAYMHIRDAMNLSSILEVKQKIKSFRDTYASERAKLRRSALTATHPSEVYRPKLRWYNLADSFLNNTETSVGADYVMPPKESQDSNVYTNPIVAPVPMFRNVQEPLHYQTAVNVRHGHQHHPQQQHHIQVQYSSRQAEQQHNFLSAQRDRQQHLNQPTRHPNAFKRMDRDMEETGEFYHFSMNIAMQLRSLPLVRALSVQNRIQQMLCEERIAYEQTRYQPEQHFGNGVTNHSNEPGQDFVQPTNDPPQRFVESIPIESTLLEEHEHVKEEYLEDDVVEIANGAL